jgi:hypothetical protein
VRTGVPAGGSHVHAQPAALLPCCSADVEEAQFLLHAGIAPDVRFEVCEGVRALCEQAVIVCPSVPQFGMTPLMKASARGHLALMNVLLNSGVREGTVKLKTKVRNAAEVNLKSDVSARDASAARRFVVHVCCQSPVIDMSCPLQDGEAAC